MNKKSERVVEHVLRDIVLICISVALALLFSELGVLAFLRSLFGGFIVIESFITGLFFTSLITTPLSIASFIEMSHYANFWAIAIPGALGALVGDIIIFVFLKETLGRDFKHLLSSPFNKTIKTVFKRRLWRWLTPFIGALIIASPLPDELGLMMMGFSKMRLSILIPISVTMNFIGIMLILGISFML